MINVTEWVNHFMGVLFEAENRRLNKMILELTELNNKQLNRSAMGFIHMGKHYVPAEYKNSISRLYYKTLPNISYTLNKEIADFLSSKAVIDKDYLQIKQLFTVLFANCNDTQDIRDSLPDCLISLSALSKVPRTKTDIMCFVQSNKHIVANYNSLLPRIEMYSVTALLY
jgi:hypothetical protein